MAIEKCISCGGELPGTPAEGFRHWPYAICPKCAEWVGSAGMFLQDQREPGKKKADESADPMETGPNH